MPKDYANIYNLSDKEFNLEIKDLWGGSVPGTEEQAKSILKKIQNDEYPFVLSVEASYGMGKTYFFSRFCEQAKKDGFDCIYISAWENDYHPSPFCFITKEILQYLENRNEPIIKSKLRELGKKGCEAIKKILLSTQIQAGIQATVVSASINVDCEKLYQNFRTPKDEIKEFKKELEKILVSNKIKPLIIVIDELDRCRPDYAIKTLEVIKHFFDVNNLYVILPINKDAIDYAVSAIYGDKNSNSEKYLKKLITQNITLMQPTNKHYQKIVETIITEEKLKKLIKLKYINKSKNYNGFVKIADCFGKYAYEGRLTYREIVNVCDEFINIINNIDGKIHIEYLIYKLCNKYAQKDIKLNNMHPFVDYISSYGEINKKTKILTISQLYANTRGLSRLVNIGLFYKDYSKEVELWERNDQFKSYEELFAFIDDVKSIKEEMLKIPYNVNIKKRLEWIFKTIEEKENEVKEYQKEYGSDDNDNETKAYYDKIIEKPLLIYENLC